MAHSYLGQEEEEDGDGGTASCSTIHEAKWRHMTDNEQTQGLVGFMREALASPPHPGLEASGFLIGQGQGCCCYVKGLRLGMRSSWYLCGGQTQNTHGQGIKAFSWLPQS